MFANSFINTSSLKSGLVPLSGSLTFCPATEGWVAPASKAAKKGKKKKGGADGGPGAEVTQEAIQAGGEQELDPEKAAKKVRVVNMWVDNIFHIGVHGSFRDACTNQLHVCLTFCVGG